MHQSRPEKGAEQRIGGHLNKVSLVLIFLNGPATVANWVPGQSVTELKEEKNGLVI